MRDILFRGKQKNTGEWVTGYYAKVKNYLTKADVDVIFLSDCELFPRNEFCVYEEVIPETIGQFTGLLDKNGVKVFEGDILRQFHPCSGETLIRTIKYEMSCGSCCTQVIGFGASGSGHTDFIQFGRSFEVIGNIHDNPELLEEKI